MLVVFGINLCGSAVADAHVVLRLPSVVHDIFLASGVALIMLTIVVGQLAAQVSSARCSIDFINYRVSLVTVWAALAIEKSGLLHACYLVQMLCSRLTGKSFDSAVATACSRIGFWVRVAFSLFALGFAFAVTLWALFTGKTAMWDDVPELASMIIFFVVLCFVGIMEGMQVAFFSVVNLPQEEFTHNPVALANCQLVFRGSNFQAFLIGRQICVTVCMFVVARITTIEASDGNVFGMPRAVQEFFQTGLLGAIITTIFGSLCWRLFASSFPWAFISNPLVYLIIRLCLWLEGSGVCMSAWLLAVVHMRLAGLQTDDVYFGDDQVGKGSRSTARATSLRYETAEC